MLQYECLKINILWNCQLCKKLCWITVFFLSYLKKMILINLEIVIYTHRRIRHAGHCWRSRDKLISNVLYGPPNMAGQKQDDQLKHTFSSYVRIWDVALKTCQRRWTIGRSGERGSGISVLVARQDDEDDTIYQPLRLGRIWHKVNF